MNKIIIELEQLYSDAKKDPLLKKRLLVFQDLIKGTPNFQIN
jgi:hypothetical protein